MQAIQIENVSKKYGGLTALDGVSLTFERGKIYGLLGRNGAGKSTLLNIMANRIFPTGGQVLIDGEPAEENMAVHGKIFCMSEQDLYDRDLKVKEHFRWTAGFYSGFDLQKATDLRRRFGLDINKTFGKLSKGYQSIFKLVTALSMDSPYIVFDEPVLGLDANNRELFYSLLLKDFREGEKTFIIATHLIGEVSGIIEDVVFIDGGRVILQSEVEELLSKSYTVSGPEKEVDDYCAGKKVLSRDSLGNLKIAYITGSEPVMPESRENLRISPLTLQKLFVKMTDGRGM